MLAETCECLGFAVGIFWTPGTDMSALHCAEVWRRPDSQLEEFESLTRMSVFSHESGLPGRVWSAGSAAWITDVMLDPNFPRATAAQSAGLHSAIAVPICTGTDGA